MNYKNKFWIWTVLLTFFVFFTLCPSSFAASGKPKISSASAVLIEKSTQNIIYDKNCHDRLEPASITKIMTAILTIEKANLDDIVTVPLDAISNIPSGYSIAELKANEQLTVDQLLQLLMVYSANDAANVLAFHVGGSIDGFANLMNQKLQELSLKDSHFTNPSGMHNDNHYTTAYDIAVLMNYCENNPTFRKYSGLESCEIPATNLSGVRSYKNTNLMLDGNSEFYYPYIISTKTGFTSQAKYCLASFAKNDVIDLICVVLGGEENNTRFTDTITLLNYGFNNLEFKNIVSKGDVVTDVTVSNATEDTSKLSLVLQDGLNLLINKQEFFGVTPQIVLNDIPTAPIKQNTVLGTATYVVNDSNYTINLIASHDVKIQSSKSYYIQLGLLIFVILLLLVLCFGNKKKE